MKDKTAVLCNSLIVYNFSCPGRHANYIGKTEQTLHEQYVEHAWTDNDSALCKHLKDCPGVQHFFDIACVHL